MVLLVMGATLVFGFMGGAFFPLDLAGNTYAAVGRMLPSAWAIRGFQDIILRAADWKTILAPAGILVLYALGFLCARRPALPIRRSAIEWGSQG